MYGLIPPYPVVAFCALAPDFLRLGMVALRCPKVTPREFSVNFISLLIQEILRLTREIRDRT